MGYDNYRVLHIGRGEADELGTITVNTELFDQFKNRDWQIVIGGGWNGYYYLVPPDEDDGPKPKGGIDDLPTLVEAIQDHMSYDQGNYISHHWLGSLPKDDRIAVLNVVRFQILNYGGEQPGSQEIERRRLELSA